MIFSPISILFFLHFLFSSADVFYLQVLFFKVKITHLFAVMVFGGGLGSFKKLFFPKDLSAVVAFILVTGIISAFNGVSIFVSLAFLFLFLFNYLFCFLTSYNLVLFIGYERLFRIYSLSFYFVGGYALCQVMLSFAGIYLPGVNQYITEIARGQAFAYEPSFYALYMTPFATYHITRYLLAPAAERRLSSLLWPNIFLLASTSTGCFFSYLFLFAGILLFRRGLKINVSFSRLFQVFFIIIGGCFGSLWALNKDLLFFGILKFFYSGHTHFSLQDRWRGIVEYAEIFWEHPLIGVGLGAGPYYVATKRIGEINSLDAEILNRFAPMNVMTEVLASFGILGFVGFLWFFYLLYKRLQNALRYTTIEQASICISLAASLCLMFFTLQFNQSIMRSYMWIHVGIFCGYLKYIELKKDDYLRRFQIA